jgi:hypothetical protein
MRIDYQVAAGRQPTMAKEKSAANYFLFFSSATGRHGQAKVHSGSAIAGARMGRGRRGRTEEEL